MATFRFSRLALADLYDIGLHTLRTWGEEQAGRYISKMEKWLLADKPTVGRLCGEVRPGLGRMEQGKHVVFYREEPGGILISRILHERMLPEIVSIDEDEEREGPG